MNDKTMENGEIVNNSQYRVLADLDQNGFGIKYENRLSAYTPPHWHRALEILLFVKVRSAASLNILPFMQKLEIFI